MCVTPSSPASPAPDATAQTAATAPSGFATPAAPPDMAEAIRPAPAIALRWRGVEPYRASFDAMRAFTASRTGETGDEIWLVEHPPVFTLGQAGKIEHLLVADSGIALVQVDRGGQITYHGPGQVVAYLLLDLRRRRLMVRELVTLIEQAVIETLAAYNLACERKAGAPGIYVSPGGTATVAEAATAKAPTDTATGGADASTTAAVAAATVATQTATSVNRAQSARTAHIPHALHDLSAPHAGAKIAALGLKIRNGCSYHGVSLNVAMDLSPFRAINPCGYAGLETIDMATLGITANWRDVAATLAASLVRNLDAAWAGSRVSSISPTGG